MSATFERFEGTLTQDTARPGACSIRVSVDVGSLRMDYPDRRRQALGPDMLDAAHFPIMRFTGICQAQSITGNLTLHGVTRSLTLALHHDGAKVIALGTVARRDFGILGMADTVAANVRIRLSVNLPR